MGHPLRFVRVLVSLGLGVAGLAGCSATPDSGGTPGVSAGAVRAMPIFRGSDEESVAWTQLVADATGADVVIIGENHGHPVGLAWAAALWEDVSGVEGAGEKRSTAALSLEFFERDDQSRLDDYLKGVTDEAAFRKRTDRTSGNYPAAHREMVERAKALGRPVIASNTPMEIIRFMRGKDYDALRTLTPEQARLFRVPGAPPEGRYRADYDALMGPMMSTHQAPPAADKKGTKGGGPNGAKAPEMTEAQKQARLDASFRTQHMWDWTMGESVALALEAGNRPVVHVEGRFHSDFFGGTPQAVAKLRPGTTVLVVSVVDASSTALREEDRGRGDFVVYVGPSPEAKSK